MIIKLDQDFLGSNNLCIRRGSSKLSCHISLLWIAVNNFKSSILLLNGKYNHCYIELSFIITKIKKPPAKARGCINATHTNIYTS